MIITWQYIHGKYVVRIGKPATYLSVEPGQLQELREVLRACATDELKRKVEKKLTQKSDSIFRRFKDRWFGE